MPDDDGKTLAWLASRHIVNFKKFASALVIIPYFPTLQFFAVDFLDKAVPLYIVLLLVHVTEFALVLAENLNFRKDICVRVYRFQ